MARDRFFSMSLFRKALIDATAPGTGLSRRGLSLAAGLGPDAVRDIISGKSKEPTYGTVRKLAAQINLPLTELIETTATEQGHQLTFDLSIKGYIEENAWRSSTAVYHTPSLSLLAPEREFEGIKRKAFEVRDYSADWYFQPGEVLDTVDAGDFDYQPRNSDLVVVERRRQELREYTVREIVATPEGQFQLYPTGRGSTVDDMWTMNMSPDGTIQNDEGSVVALVRGSYRPYSRVPGREERDISRKRA